MNDVLDRIKKYVKDKICYAGRLDPLAQGKLIILTYNDIYDKMLYCNLDKTYSFVLLHGFITDTHDILGLPQITTTDYNMITHNDYMMEYPKYSSYKINKKPLWYYTKNNIQVTIPKKLITVKNIKKLNDIEITGENLYKLIKYKIDKIHKQTFRQAEIIKQWHNVINFNNVYYATRFTITMTSGGFVRYFGNIMNGTSYDITRMDYNISLYIIIMIIAIYIYYAQSCPSSSANLTPWMQFMKETDIEHVKTKPISRDSAQDAEFINNINKFYGQTIVDTKPSILFFVLKKDIFKSVYLFVNRPVTVDKLHDAVRYIKNKDDINIKLLRLNKQDDRRDILNENENNDDATLVEFKRL